MGIRYTEVGRLMNEGNPSGAADAIVAALVEHGGNQTRAAEALGRVNDRTMRRWIKTLVEQGRDVRVEAAAKLATAPAPEAPPARPAKRRKAA
jgi:transposase-like protein